MDELLSESNTVQTLERFLFISSVMIVDNQSGLLSMLGFAHVTKLCKDIGKGVDRAFDPNTLEIWLRP